MPIITAAEILHIVYHIGNKTCNNYNVCLSVDMDISSTYFVKNRRKKKVDGLVVKIHVTNIINVGNCCVAGRMIIRYRRRGDGGRP